MDISINQRREYIVLTAVELLHENGAGHVSTKEIARRLGISEAMVFKIFPKKNDIMIAVLDHFARYDKDIMITASEKCENSYEAILFIANSLLTYYENYPAIISVYQIMVTAKGNPELEKRSEEICNNRLECYKQLILKAQRDGRMNETLDPELVADCLIFIFRGMCSKWRHMDCGFPLKDRTNKAIELYLSALEK